MFILRIRTLFSLLVFKKNSQKAVLLKGTLPLDFNSVADAFFTE